MTHRLNVGCGEFPAVGWINCDVYRTTPALTVQASTLALPFQDESVWCIYAGHVLEHIDYADIPIALAEWHRVLVPEGTAAVVGPDIDLAQQHHPHDKALHDGVVGGAGRWPGDEHRWLSTGGKTLRAINAAGGWRTKSVPITAVPRVWPVTSYADWQFAILLWKER